MFVQHCSSNWNTSLVDVLQITQSKSPQNHSAPCVQIASDVLIASLVSQVH